MTAATTLSRELKLAIFAGCMISFNSFGFSASFSVFLRPISNELGWGREVFSLSLAIQALIWGITQPLAGMYADKHGSSRVLAFGAVVAALGFALRGVFDDPTLFILTGFIVGVGTGACSFPVVDRCIGQGCSTRAAQFHHGSWDGHGLGGHVCGCAHCHNADWLDGLGHVDLFPSVFIRADPAASDFCCACVGNTCGRWYDKQCMGCGQSRLFRSVLHLVVFRLFRLWISRSVYSNPPTRLYHRRRLNPDYWRMVTGLDWIVQHRRIVFVRLVRAGLSKTQTPLGIYLTRAIIITLFIMAPLTDSSVLFFSAAMGICGCPPCR